MGTWPENLSKKLIKKLAQGKESTTQLQTLLHKPFGENGSISAEQLANKILTSFTDTISVLMNISNNNNNTSSDHDRQPSETVINGGHDVISQINPHEPLDHHSHCDDRSSEDSGESFKKRPAFKDRRGCYKRRKSSQSWSTVTSTIEDGQAWRKYGQKAILNSEYPRSYFRCTRKHDQGCKATKQVQQTQGNPNLYQTTYIGQHTCKYILKSPQMIIDSQPYNVTKNNNNNNNSSTTTNDNNNNNNKYTKSEQVKLEETQLISEDQYMSDDKSSFDTDDLWSDFKDIELPQAYNDNKNIIGSSENDDHVGNSITYSFFDQTNGSSLISLDDMDDFVVKSIEFRDTDFHFDDSNFPIGLA